MRISLRTGVTCVCALAASTFFGCGEKFYRSETTLHADGSVDRAIYQERNETPEEVLRPELWTRTTHAALIEPGKWNGLISELPEHAADQKHPYFAAWGHFESPSKLPAHFLKKGIPGGPEGRLALDYSRVDFGFVIEHRWRETLTDVVTLDDMHQARASLVELMIGLGHATLDDVYGAEHDFTGLVKWFETEGTAWFNEATDLLYDLGARRELNQEPRYPLAFAKICQRHGLDLFDAEGDLIPSEQSDALIAHFARRILRRNIKRKDGTLVAEKVIEAILKSYKNEPLEQPPANGPVENKPSPLELSCKKLIEQKFGGQAAFEERVVGLAARIVGIYYVEFLGPPRRFVYRLKMPGSVVETTGKLLSPQEVEWTFDAKQAFPLGYSMECRSLEPLPELQKSVLLGEPLQTQESLLRYVAILAADRELREAIQACAAQKTLTPLSTYRKGMNLAADSPSAVRLLQLFKLLRLPTAPN